MDQLERSDPFNSLDSLDTNGLRPEAKLQPLSSHRKKAHRWMDGKPRGERSDPKLYGPVVIEQMK